ncbi:hypothetical protein BJX99DRAFT_220424 [Aspergillus californicus]
MPSFLSLPGEIIHRVFFYAEQSRKQLRLSSTLLAKAGRSWVFQSTTLSRTKSSCERFQNILDRPDLARAVKKVYLDTTDPQDGNNSVTTSEGDEYLEADEADEDEDSALPPRFWKAVNRLDQLPRLQSVVIRFHHECEGDDDWGNAEQSSQFRAAVLRKTLSVLASLPRPLHELGIQDLQNIMPDDEAFRANLNKVLGAIKSLRLNIANQLNEGNGENNVEYDAVHKFFNNDLASFWLKPAMANVEHLTIYSSMYWGFFPKCDLRDVHFPRLKTLSLGNFAFIDDSQLQWILSHGETLEELYLDDCPILHEVAVDNAHRERGTLLDNTSFQAHPGFEHESEPSTTQYHYCKLHASYSARWADYFRAFAEKLPRLRHIRVGSHPEWWCDETTPFEKETGIKIGFKESYMVYCDGYGPSQYMASMIHDDTFDGCDDRKGEEIRASEEDKAALRELMEKLGQSTDSMDRHR